jgi:prepilin-type N-terminal cleavage/methylation domain-containing protein
VREVHIMRKHVLTDQSGFTLMEILIVVILLGILAMVVVPQITISSEDTKAATLQSNLGQMRSLLEIYYAQHNEKYPGEINDVTGSGAPSDAAVAFVNQLTLYTKSSGAASKTDKTNFPLGPYIKGSTLPPNPFNNESDVIIDNNIDDLTARTLVAGDDDYGYKFFLKTGVLIACDGGTSNEVDHENF